jgi:DNA-binding response OmpR family regulator
MIDSGIVSLDGQSNLSDALKDRSILVLDDEESIRMLLEEGLSVQGFQVDTAATPEAALALARRRSYDFLLCDLNLSSGGAVISGTQAAELVLAASSDRKPVLIYMTGHLVETPNGDRNLTSPRRLQKPFRISDVLALLREISWDEAPENVRS